MQFGYKPFTRLWHADFGLWHFQVYAWMMAVFVWARIVFLFATYWWARRGVMNIIGE